MTYRFSLEALKQYRTYQQEECQKEMAEAQRHRDRQAEHLEALRLLRETTENNLNKSQQESITGPRLAIFASYLDKIASDIFSQKHKLAEAEKTLENKRDALLTAMQERKVLEKLKEKGLKAYLAHLSHEETKFINEMAISRHAMKQR